MHVFASCRSRGEWKKLSLFVREMFFVRCEICRIVLIKILTSILPRFEKQKTSLEWKQTHIRLKEGWKTSSSSPHVIYVLTPLICFWQMILLSRFVLPFRLMQLGVKTEHKVTYLFLIGPDWAERHVCSRWLVFSLSDLHLAKQIFGSACSEKSLARISCEPRAEWEGAGQMTWCQQGVKLWPRFLHKSLSWRTEKILLIQITAGRLTVTNTERERASREKVTLSSAVRSCDRSCIIDFFLGRGNMQMRSSPDFCLSCIFLFTSFKKQLQVWAVNTSSGSAGGHNTTRRSHTLSLIIVSAWSSELLTLKYSHLNKQKTTYMTVPTWKLPGHASGFQQQNFLMRFRRQNDFSNVVHVDCVTGSWLNSLMNSPEWRPNQTHPAPAKSVDFNLLHLSFSWIRSYWAAKICNSLK